MTVPPATSPLTNFGWLLAERGWRVLLGLVVNVAVARHLGPEDFGLLSYAVSLVAIGWTLGGLGIDEILARELVRNRAGAPALFAAALRLKAVGALCGFLGLLLTTWWWQPGGDGAGLVVILAGAGLFFLPLDAVDVWFQSRERMRPPVMARQGALLGSALLRLALVGLGAPLWTFALAFTIEALLVALALGWLLVRDTGWPDWKGAARFPGRTLLREGWPLLASGGLVVIALQSDRMLLLLLAGEAEAGVYAAAARFTEVLYVLPMALGTVLLPRLTALKQHDEPAYWRMAQRTALFLLAAAVVLAAGLSGGSHWLLPVLLGEEYRASGDVLAVHGWSLVFIALVSLRSRLLIIEGRSSGVLALSFGTTLLNVLGNLWLIPRWGALGAAGASVGAWACSALVLPWVVPSLRGFMRQWCGLAKSR